VYFYSAINNCTHCAVVSSKPVVSFQQAPEALITVLRPYNSTNKGYSSVN